MKLAALATKHHPTPTALTRVAATIGPTARPTLTRVLLSVTALRISRSPTISEMNARRAGLSRAVSVPNTSAITNTIHSRTAPLITSAPSTSEVAASNDWVSSSSRRLVCRSTITPAYGVSKSTGAYRAAVASPSQTPEWVSCSTSIACATVSVHEPTRLIVWPATKRRKLGTANAASGRTGAGCGSASMGHRWRLGGRTPEPSVHGVRCRRHCGPRWVHMLLDALMCCHGNATGQHDRQQRHPQPQVGEQERSAEGSEERSGQHQCQPAPLGSCRRPACGIAYQHRPGGRHGRGEDGVDSEGHGGCCLDAHRECRDAEQDHERGAGTPVNCQPEHPQRELYERAGDQPSRHSSGPKHAGVLARHYRCGRPGACPE